MESEEKIDALIKEAVVLGLDGTELFGLHGFKTVREAYNGIGPEFLPAKIREKTTKLLSLFEPAALIHDIRNEFSDGTRYAFNRANYEFLGNYLKIANAKFPWYSPRRWIARNVARVLYDFVSGDSGWRAWIEAKERHAAKLQKKG